MRKVLFVWVGMALLVSACGGDADADKEEKSKEGKTGDNKEIVKPEDAAPKMSMDNVIADFLQCKATATETTSCQHFIAKAICGQYGINDFETDTEKGYILYNDIKDAVRASSKWSELGPANDQSALDEAQRLANEGVATIAFSDKNYGHVVIVMPGEQEKANSWGGLNVPVCASLFMIDMEPFNGKTLAYAWGKPDDIVLFARK